MTQFKLIRSDLIHEFPELNLSNYSDDDVRKLNQWGINLVTQPVVESEPVAWRWGDGKTWIYTIDGSIPQINSGDYMVQPLYTTPQSESARIAQLEADKARLVEALGSVVKIYNKAPDSHTNIASDAMMRTAKEALTEMKGK